MKKDILFTLPSYFRDDMNIMAYRFGKGEKTCAVVGALRGDEVQQLYVCARLVSFLREVEKEDGVQPGKSVMIVPTVIGASMNEGSRLWEPENMDINRRFPGDVTGSTTERIAGALLDRLKNYRYGVQLTSFYQPGSFVPHVRMMDTGRQNPDLGCEFGLPYVYVRTPRSYDQTTLNYNWQLCGTQAYSLYAGKTREIDEAAADQTLRAIVRFLNSRGVIRSETAPGHPSTIITNADMISVSATSAGLLRRIKFAARMSAAANSWPSSSTVRRFCARGAQSAGHGHALLHAGRPVHHRAQPGFPRCSRGRKAMTKRLPAYPHALSIAVPVTLQNLLASSFHADRYHDDRQTGRHAAGRRGHGREMDVVSDHRLFRLFQRRFRVHFPVLRRGRRRGHAPHLRPDDRRHAGSRPAVHARGASLSRWHCPPVFLR